jgi:fimbrial chaperone protein
MKERSITKRGEEKLSPEKQDFIIAPPQTILDPGEQQVVRLQYVGPASLTSEAAYRLIADPVQVRKPEQMDGTKVNILFRYEASVYVTPENTKPDLIAEDVKLAQGDGANTTLVVSFKNQGGRHILPQNLEPVVTTGDERVPLTDASVETFRKTNFLAGSTVVLQLDLKRELHSADGLDVALR